MPSSLAEVLAGTPQETQESNLYWHHLNNLYGPGKSVSPNGGISTLYQAVLPGPAGKFYNVPTIWDGNALTTQESAERAASAGWGNWPSYSTPEAADLAYEARVHPQAMQDTQNYLATHGLAGVPAGMQMPPP